MIPGDTVKWIRHAPSPMSSNNERPVMARIIAISPDRKKVKIIPIFNGKDGEKRIVLMRSLKEKI